MLNRRDWIASSLAAGGALTIAPQILKAIQQGQLITRAIPGTSERIPVIGLGSSATFSRMARSEDYSALRDVLGALVEHGATVFDTAPGYGASEEVAGDIAQELGITDNIFWATKLNVAGRGGGSADPDRARQQLHNSFERLHTSPIDLIQVHNLGDPPTQLGMLQELKQEGSIRYYGITTTSQNRYPELMDIMRNEPIDFVGIDYAVDNRDVEESVLPLAQERNIGVLVYAPFGRTRLWQRTADREVPEWAQEFDAGSWAQFFLKYVVSHPAVTAATPATSQARHMIDNIGGGIGRLPNDRQRARMAELVDALPPAPPRRRG